MTSFASEKNLGLAADQEDIADLAIDCQTVMVSDSILPAKSLAAADTESLAELALNRFSAP
jgi:hypothetical protein